MLKKALKKSGRLIPFVIIVTVFLLNSYCFSVNSQSDTVDNPSLNVLSSAGKYPHIRGFRNSVNVIITLNNETGRIDKIEFPPNQEDKRFWDKVMASGIFSKYAGVSPEDALLFNIDTVTGATYSSTAAEKTIHALLSDYIALPDTPPEATWSFSWRDAGAIIIILLNIFLFIKPVAGRKRVLLSVINVVLFGFILHGYLSLQQIGSWLSGLPFLSLSMPLILFLLVIVISLIRGGNFYCTCLCPFGCAQEITAKLGSKAGIKPIPVRIKSLKILRKLIVLATLTALLLGITIPAWEPFAIFSFIPGAAIWTTATVFLLASLFIPRLWCRFFCGCGELLDWFSKPAWSLSLRKKRNLNGKTNI